MAITPPGRYLTLHRMITLPGEELNEKELRLLQDLEARIDDTVFQIMSAESSYVHISELPFPLPRGVSDSVVRELIRRYDIAGWDGKRTLYCCIEYYSHGERKIKRKAEDILLLRPKPECSEVCEIYRLYRNNLEVELEKFKKL